MAKAASNRRAAQSDAVASDNTRAEFVPVSDDAATGARASDTYRPPEVVRLMEDLARVLAEKKSSKVIILPPLAREAIDFLVPAVARFIKYGAEAERSGSIDKADTEYRVALGFMVHMRDKLSEIGISEITCGLFIDTIFHYAETIHHAHMPKTTFQIYRLANSLGISGEDRDVFEKMILDFAAGKSEVMAPVAPDAARSEIERGTPQQREPKKRRAKKANPQLTAARLKAAYEVLVRESDLANPALSDDERLRRSEHLLQTYKRLRRRDPKFHDTSSELKAARSIVNSRNYQQRQAKLAAA